MSEAKLDTQDAKQYLDKNISLHDVSEFLFLTTFTNRAGLECLCSILKCMVEWSREYYIDPSTTGLNAVYRSESDTATAAEGETNGTDGGGGGAIVIMETLEPQTAAGRQIRGSFSTLRAEAGE